ncbi:MULTISPECIES: PP2C family protein-serine/threonine phosphatase [unclassified Streptomyces]|uniref:PP2C family protein-serine/threonine phosphatase n=1 Tax=unclassified Streptomyces TaxID=2593676 RepID=UPI00278C4C76|nr:MULTISPECIES: PP2C family protein-serine/threonine phosphatase [unclassified Streptomyces]
MVARAAGSVRGLLESAWLPVTAALMALAACTARQLTVPTSTPLLSYVVEYAVLLVGGLAAVRVAARSTANAAALTRATEAARVAQAAILRPVSARFGGIDVCTRHHCPVRESTLGGDVYDVVRTPFGPRVFIGDVRGHGLEAVRVSAAAVGAYRDLAYTVPSLAGLVRGLDEAIAPYLGPEDFITAVFAEFGPGELRLVNCGHPAPLRVGSQVKFLEPKDASTPLGLAPDPEQRLFWLQPGDRVLFYTDGLIEARDASGADFPLADHAERVIAPMLPEEALDALYAEVTAHVGAPLTDDVALVLCEAGDPLLSHPPVPTPRGSSGSTSPLGTRSTRWRR